MEFKYLIEFIEKLDISNRNKLLVSILGLTFPSLTYFSLNFTDKFFNEDILKTIILCFGVNFVIISLTVAIQIITNAKWRLKGATKILERLTLKIRERINDDIDDETFIDNVDKLHDSIKKYLSEILDVNSFISYSSAFHLLYGGMCIAISQFFDINSQIKFIRAYLILYLVSFFILVLTLTYSKHKNSIDSLNKQLDSL